jgi:alkanesulfonate monooxygenase SsuD/methylene tetrahydromethanopterin reductase-like flavin-dependent oxidoreductase (luciferase family)
VTVKVGVRIPYELFEQDARALRTAVARAEASGLDHLCMGDHVSFHGGQGFDGLLQAAALASLTSAMTVETAVYLLALRHPVPVARQVATIAQLAPGRFVFGVGLGGEDRHELEICGVDPATRGRRLDESLTIVRALLAGGTVDFAGRSFTIEQARILPAPPVPVPILVGGRSPAAFRRAARLGDGWLGLFVSADRYRESVAEVQQLAATNGRADVEWNHGMHFWCGVGPSPDRLATAMESLYQIPFARFERYAPYGTPEAIADYVGPYLDAGAKHVNLAPVAATPEAAIDTAAAVADLLHAR